MKLYAQHGATQGEKTLRGIERGFVDGVIYSPRDINADRLREHIARVAQTNRDARQYFDPQYYAAYNVNHPAARFGRLDTCEEYEAFFHQRRRRELEGDTDLVRQDIQSCIAFQDRLDVAGVISPNILISRSFDSIEAVISKNFIRQAGRVHSEMRCDKPLFVTLAASREALIDRNELLSFLEDITVLREPPDGFYVLISVRSEDARPEVFHADVIAGWLLLNHSLSINGFEVINGYSDILSPFLGAAGASAGATGWWSNLRSFSLSRFLPVGGGRLPIPRYLSKLLLNRITHFELSQIQELRRVIPGMPDLLNDIDSDGLYPADNGYEPDRADEVLQTWDALRSMCQDFCVGDQVEMLQECRLAVRRAAAAYDAIESQIRLDQKSNAEHLDAIREGLRLFRREAEIADA